MFLKTLRKRIRDLSKLITRLNNRAINLLERLENESLEIEKHNSRLEFLTLIIKTLVKIQKTPILNRKGLINPATDNLLKPNLTFRVQQEERIKYLIYRTGIIAAILVSFGLGACFIFTQLGKDQKLNKPNQHQANIMHTII